MIKSNFNLANVMGTTADLELEELRLVRSIIAHMYIWEHIAIVAYLQERTELEARSKVLHQRQRCIESMLTDLTRSIKQMEFDIDLMHIQKPAPMAPQDTTNSEQPAKREQKI